MAETKSVDIDALRASVTRQGGLVRTMKKSGAPQAEVTAAVAVLKALKAELEAACKAEEDASPKIDRVSLEDLLRRRMFVIPSFEIYGGVGGFFDFGPPGCALKANFLDCWRRHFVLKEDMLEIECTTMMPDIVLRTSGHVEKFTDLMVKDPVSGECFRADKLLEDHVENMLKDTSLSNERREELALHARKADAYSPEELHVVLTELGVKSPSTGNELTKPFPFNLMFASTIGPEGNYPGFLRPETAQGMFINFRRLLDYNAGRMPFAAAQIGLAFRNEISPRAGLLRVREFTMAEIEHFVDPANKEHPSFGNVADMKLTLFPAANQVGSGKTVTGVTLAQAVEDGTIDNQTLAYFMGRTALFMTDIGIRPEWMRFRQHMSTEMAHYASDCWDCELYTSYGWVECVGIADRACYDLSVHAAKSKVDLSASKRLSSPVEQASAKLKANKGLMGRHFKKEMQKVMAHIEALSCDQALAMEDDLAANGSVTVTLEDGSEYTITREMLSFTRTTKMVSEVRFSPSVIEPSFGVGRVLYALMEHVYSVRSGDEQRGVLSFPAAIAPIKVAVLPLSGHADFKPAIARIQQTLTAAGVTNKVDNSSTAIGRRYSRMDELGVPLAVTIDFETASTGTITLRARDSTAQVRLPEADLLCVVQGIVSGGITFDSLLQNYPVVSTGIAADGSALPDAQSTVLVHTIAGSAPASSNVVADINTYGARKLRFSRPAPAQK